MADMTQGQHEMFDHLTKSLGETMALTWSDHQFVREHYRSASEHPDTENKLRGALRLKSQEHGKIVMAVLSEYYKTDYFNRLPCYKS